MDMGNGVGIDCGSKQGAGWVEEESKGGKIETTVT